MSLPLPPDHAPASGSGQPLPDDVRVRMEHALGSDFSAVRVHEGPQAAAVGALAYTQGAHIHFAPGQYQPQSQRGQELLGHELTHVVQQADSRVHGAAQAQGRDIQDDPVLEREADEIGARAAAGQRADSAIVPRHPGSSGGRRASSEVGDGAPIQRKPERTDGGTGWHDREIADGVGLELLGESDGKRRFRIRDTDIEFAHSEEGDRYYDPEDMWIDATDLTRMVMAQRRSDRMDRPHAMRRRTTGREDDGRRLETGRLPWLADRFTLAKGSEITAALQHALIIYDSMGHSSSDGENFRRDAETWQREYQGVATISFLELMLDTDSELKQHIRELISDHVQRHPLNVVVLGHGQAYKNLYQVMRDDQRRPAELHGKILIDFLDKLAELTGHQPIGSLMLHGCGTVRTAQEIDAVMRDRPSTGGERMIGEIFSPERIQSGIELDGPVRRYAEHLGPKYDRAHAQKLNRHNYVKTLKENNVGSLTHIATTASSSSLWRFLSPFLCGMGAPEPQAEKEPEELPSEAHRLVNSFAGNASLSFSDDWQLIALAYDGTRVESAHDLPARVEDWIRFVRGVMEGEYGPLENNAGLRIAWTPERVRQIMEELGFFA